MTVRRGEEGFTLVEVLVAFVVFAATVIVSFRIFNDGLEQLRAAERKAAAVAIARREMALLELLPRLTAGMRTGIDGDFHWSAVLTAAPADREKDDAARPIRAVISVAWNEKPEAPLFVLDTTLLAAVAR